MSRRELREHIFHVLFQIEFHEEEEWETCARLYFEQLVDASAQEIEYMTRKFLTIAKLAKEIDQKLNEQTTGWKTTRMNRVDLTILRLAVYEIVWDEEVPTGVAINEAVELAKRYSGEEGPSFINGVLAKFAV
jgi:N utilization substance protein B